MKDQTGSVAPLTAVMLLGLLAIAALVVDGGILFAARRDLQATADSAARAGAMAIDIEALRGRQLVQLNPVEARGAAQHYLSTAGFNGTSTIHVNNLVVTVHIRESRPTVMMGLLGLRTLDVQAKAVARPRTGITRPEG